ncbi:Zn2+/Cd2+-exporting ATPase [Cytobacillus horneckiae]|uniref:Heavy metal translocating P-type ATPase n=1 Tax=Cytobacillus horneckiae TaxID=549687 RepID=A0A2N0ZKB1_9BACI|nr:heavy metal translocating P-type ATPase [Cytobacillus horneckiae]MBN6888190.1 cadmium-translocating P-type ATPase [Cytobacillus horneckiae]MEC1154745.1 heavy metal translocating P-type ATPase [Cytobacillus horneckiae]MED2940238.1 heavy metal translocating P-type ATPase [Cytobacillus horneckiae]PKG29906.1 heavy metal translocating P-type ATPase [Cytobacillus horneckiae]
METEIKPMLKQNKQSSNDILESIKPHAELIAALFCGVLILTGWLLDRNDLSTLSVITYMLAFIIGGYAKAKEGMEETFANKELNVEMLMIFAAIGSAIIGYWTEGAILIFIFALSGALETYTMNKSNKEISALMDLQPEEALLINHGMEEKIHVSKLSIGDLILVKPGERVPSDGKIIRGQSTLDEAAITGESIPISKGTNDEVFAGTVNLNGALTVEITKHNHETLFQKIIQLVQTAQSEKSPSQLFIEKFEGKYVKIVLITVAIMMVLPHFLLGWSWNETFYRAMILLVVASPCALVASIMPATLSAISNGARKGILFKGGVHLENLSHLKAIAFDKTGTLTKGKPEVTDFITKPGMDADEILLKTASIENQSAHPLATALVNYTKKRLNQTLLQPEELRDVSGWGVEAVLGSENWKIGKTAFFDQSEIAAFANGLEIQLANEGKTIVFIQRNKEIVGMVAFKDIVRSETKAAIKQLQDQGIYTIMLTGDSQATASAIAAESKVDQYIAECLPEEKVNHVKSLRDNYDNVAMVGDGINDAPALATANVGIAMGEGTDVALETADVVLMKNDLPKIAEAIELSRRMNKIIKQNVIFSITVIMFLIASNFLQVLDLPYGVIGHEGSTILVILNSLRLLKS